MHSLQIGLIGDRNDDVVAHRAIPLALGMAAEACGVEIEPIWVPTDEVGNGAALAEFDGLWCVPASPYRSMEGALTAIQVARERHVPFLGTCGGFQHAVIEYARNVLGWADAEHAETSPEASRQVIVPLLCSLVEVTAAVNLVEGSHLAQAYGVSSIVEGYHCNYGLSSDFRAALADGPLRIDAVDDAGDVRGIELDDHPFFVATLFQHERSALQGAVAAGSACFCTGDDRHSLSMHCPFCQHEDTRVIDSRLTEDGGTVRRRRECPQCGERFNTFETAELKLPTIVKSGERREVFDERKLRVSFERALQKRPVATQDVDSAVRTIINDLRRSGEREVSSRQLGELVMRELKNLDQVAYVRFASVYRKFEDVHAFREEIEKLERDLPGLENLQLSLLGETVTTRGKKS